MRIPGLTSWLLLAPLLAVAAGISRPQAQTGKPIDDLCADRAESRRQRHCEVREDSIAGQHAIDLDPGRNGSVRVRGWERPEVHLRARVEAYAETQSRARELASAVQVTTTAGRVRSDGPMTLDGEHWATSFYLDVPRNVRLAINTHNGGISLEELSGTAMMRAVNGGITLRRVGGDLKGQTRNGGIRVELAGARWEGTGLDVETRNGGVRLTLPADYSAELETGTVNGRVDIDFPVLI
ncbi:MAG: hypothetical protein EHM55_17260, partial [Acidobacteria bacterium]